MYRIIETKQLYKYEELRKEAQRVARYDYCNRYNGRIERKISNKIKRKIMLKMNHPFISNKNFKVNFYTGGHIYMQYDDYSYSDNSLLEKFTGYLDMDDLNKLIDCRNNKSMRYVSLYIAFFNYKDGQTLNRLYIDKMSKPGNLIRLEDDKMHRLKNMVKEIEAIVIDAILEATKNINGIAETLEKEYLDDELEKDIIKSNILYEEDGSRSRFKEKDFDEAFLVKPNRKVIKTKLSKDSEYGYFEELLVYEFDELGRNARLKAGGKDGLYLKDGAETNYNKADFGLKKHTYLNDNGKIVITDP